MEITGRQRDKLMRRTVRGLGVGLARHQSRRHRGLRLRVLLDQRRAHARDEDRLVHLQQTSHKQRIRPRASVANNKNRIRMNKPATESNGAQQAGGFNRRPKKSGCESMDRMPAIARNERWCKQTGKQA